MKDSGAFGLGVLCTAAVALLFQSITDIPQPTTESPVYLTCDNGTLYRVNTDTYRFAVDLNIKELQ